MKNLKKILLFFHTIRHLKPRQVIYQLRYRLNWKYSNFNYIGKSKIKFNFDLQLADFPVLKKGSSYQGNGRFTFLNKNKTFTDKINWNFSDYGKLWNYQLQYLNYILDEQIPVDERLGILIDISQQINGKKLKSEPYPISLRLTNTLIFIQKHSIQNEEINKAIKFQLSFLENNLEYHLLANHLLENYISLCFTFVVLNNEKKKTKYFKLLLEGLAEQILADGAHYERTPAYHTQILIHLLQLVFLMESTNQPSEVLIELKNTCSKMFGWYNGITINGTQVPLLNDSARSTTSTYHELQEMANHCNIKPEVNQFSDSGFRILRNKDLTLIINCGNITPSYQPGHAHADMLHFVLYFKGEEILVDTGISTYEVIPERSLEKSTRMHNTVSVGVENQSQIWASFRMAKRASTRILEESNEKLVAEVKWYNGILHKRSFSLSNEKLIIEDSLSNLLNQEELPKANFHFDHLLKDALDIYEDTVSVKRSGLKIQFNHYKTITRENYLQAEDFNKQNQAVKISTYFTGYLKTVVSWNP